MDGSGRDLTKGPKPVFTCKDNGESSFRIADL
jgi:hypothetical protein